MATNIDNDFDLPEFKLPILAADERPVFQCPDEQTPISEAVHLARLASGWTSCAECVSNGHRGDQQRIQSDAADSAIRRTACGVRGAYLNAIDRFRAAQLGAIMAGHISRVASVQAALRMGTDGAQVAPVAQICVGYDDRTGSQDLFAGVVSAVLQNGCNVIDAGRSTTASLMSLCRTSHRPDGCIMVTGNESPTGQVGMDVFDGDGRAISILWTDFGVGVRLPEANKTEESMTGPRWETTAAKNRLAPSTVDAPAPLPSMENGILQLPDMSESQQVFRIGRTSGVLSPVEVERDYTKWLSRWWPASFDKPVSVKANSGLVFDRLSLLAGDNSSIEVLSPSHELSADARRLSFVVSEDDRYLEAWSQSGRRIESAELANWINQASRSIVSHVTAHPSDDGRQVLLVDLAGPGSQQTHVIISDALAVIGIVLTLAHNPKNLLPA